METLWEEEERKIEEEPRPCPFCGGRAVVEKKGNSIAYWVVRCSVCRASVKGTYKELAVGGWNERPTMEWQPLGTHTFLLPSGQKYQHVLVYEDGKVTFVDYVDGKVASSVDVDLGHFRIAVKRGKDG